MILMMSHAELYVFLKRTVLHPASRVSFQKSPQFFLSQISLSLFNFAPHCGRNDNLWQHFLVTQICKCYEVFHQRSGSLELLEILCR